MPTEAKDVFLMLDIFAVRVLCRGHEFGGNAYLRGTMKYLLNDIQVGTWLGS
jgi:hypothetical protein